MSPIQNFEQHSRRLVEPDLPIQARLEMVVEVRDSLEITHTAEYLNFLKCYFRASSVILFQITKPQFTDNLEHKLRNIVVEILNRLPHSEVLRPFVQDLLKVAMQVLTTDNEENGLICIRIIFDLLRNFRPTLENEVQPFLDFVCKIYQNFRSTVCHFFDYVKMEEVKPMEISTPSDQSLSITAPSRNGQINPSTRSFKIVTESPLVVMFLFQLYSRLVQINIPNLLPLMVAAISIPGPEKVSSHMKPQFIELKGAQVKTVSFLTYLLKSCAEYIRPHEKSICKSIVNLLVTCSDSVSIRKELLVSLKHVLGTDFKRGLFPLIDTLLEERVLVGTGRACFESLRPLAYSLLAEIVHHVRADLSLSQLSRIIYLFSRNMHDSTLSLNIHTTCARLMLNLVEPIFEKGVDQHSMDEARILLGRILDAFVGKFNTFKRTIPQLLEEGDGKDQITLRSKLELPVQAVLNLQVPAEHSKEVNDCKNLIKTLVMGMKTIIWSITHAHLPRPQGMHPQALASQSSASQVFKGMREDEVLKASGVLKSGVHCLALFKDKDEEKEMLNLFSQILAIMEPRDLMDMFSVCMAELFECMIDNTQLVQIFATLLQAPKVYKPFADVLINFLVSSKLDVLKNPDSAATKLVLHLFRCLFGAVSKTPSDFERILQPQVPIIMEVCMKNATEIENTLGYMQLLRIVFRGLAGCKFELLLRDLIPMLLPCLNILLTMLEGPAGEDMRDLLLELSLTLPARLSSLLPYLPRLMRPLVSCLRGSDELVSLGLRTLEFWVDSLNPDFLEPSMANVMSEVILALWSHLKPVPYPWGGKALQIVGKLGGRNRRFLKEPLTLECKDNPEHGLRLVLTFEPSTPFLVPMDKFINLAVAAVIQKNLTTDIFYKKQALKFLRVCLLSQLNLPGCVTDEGQMTKQLSALLLSSVDSSWRRSEPTEVKADLGVKTKTQLIAEKSIFKTLLITIIASSSDPDLSDSDDDFVVNICRHFAIILHGDCTSSYASTSTAPFGGSVSSTSSKPNINWSTNLKHLDPLIFLDALVDVLADENRLHAKAALTALNVFAETLLFLARVKHADVLMAKSGHSASMIVSSPSTNPVYSPHPSVRIPVFEQLLPRLLHCCYGSTWQAQMGGVMGLGTLVGKVNVETLCLFQVKIVRGLVYVQKRLPIYASKEQDETSQVLMQILRVVNNVDEANSDARRQSFQGVVEYLATELFNPNASITVRKNVQNCLALLASRTGSEVSELLEPLYQPLLQPLIMRPLRSKTIDQQVGTVTALNFCLALRPPLLKVTPLGSAAGAHPRQSQRTDSDSAVTSSRQTADVGVVISNIKSVLELIDERVMLLADCKRPVTQILNTLLSEKGTDSSVLICVLDMLKRWAEDDFGKTSLSGSSGAFLTQKDIVSFLQKLAQVDKQHFSSVALDEWDKAYLQLLYGLCADSTKYPLALRQEISLKVERHSMLGLRARDPDMRRKFFLLYHESLGKNLFARLQYIIQNQDWEAMGDVFWLKQGLDLLLAILIEEKPITLAPNSARVVPLLSSQNPGTHYQPPAMPEGPEEVGSMFDSIVMKHAQFLSAASKLQVADVVIPLRELAHTDANVAYHLWVLVFPIVWATLHKEEQKALAKPMISLLSKDYHKKQQGHRPNVVQALLEGLQLSHPQPRMPSELIKYIGKTYNAWHLALTLLETHVMLFTNESRCAESLAELYRLLNEDDRRFGLWKNRSNTTESRAGLSMVQHGFWQRAQSLFYQAMVKATQGTYNNTVPKAEMCLWEEQWLHCATQLGQWDALVDFGKSTENYEILLDSLWKAPDWAYLKDHVIPKAQVEETPKLRLVQACFALHEKNANGVGDAENIVGKGVDLALEQWWQLPEMSLHARVPLLQQFQQLVEVQESSRIYVDITNGSKVPGNAAVGGQGNHYADLKDILETWRLRTPNEWDNMTIWYDMLQWRNEMYNVVIDAFKDFITSNTQLHHLGYRDKAWNVNKLARIARKQGLYDVSVQILEKMYGHSQMEVQEAFVKIKEQAKAHLETKGELATGLNLVNSTNLEFFLAKNKAEIFRLKGDFHLKLNDTEGANIAYSNAITLFKNLPKGWISWGNYCEMAYQETQEEIWLEYAVSCFLQGIRFGVSNSRSHMARVLYLLSFDTANEHVGRTFDKHLDQVPHWVWLSWIPQLLLSLQRTEAPHCKLVLMKIAAVFPQALYYWLRTYLLERRDAVNKSELSRIVLAQRMQQNVPGVSAVHGGGNLPSETQIHQGAQTSGAVGTTRDNGNPHAQESERAAMENNVNSGNDQPMNQSSSTINENSQHAVIRDGASLAMSAAGAFDAAKDIMEALRSKHNNLASELEVLLTEIGSRFVTLPEERLLAVVNALLHRCYKYPTATTAEVPQPLKKELSGVCRACFSADAVTKHVAFVREYKQDFDFNVVDVEIPGQYFADQEVAPDHTVKLDRVGADIQIVRRHGSSCRRLTLIGSDGSQKHFIVQTSLTPNARSDERILQVFRVMNQMFDKHKESRRRHIGLHTPIIIPVWSQVRMVEDDLMYNTFLEVYENHCERNGRESDHPITYFKEKLNQAISGQISPEAIGDLRLQAYGEITKNIVNDTIFSQYMYKTSMSGSHLWAFKKQFAVQLAVSNFMSFILQIGGRSPNKILFAKNTGKMFQTDFHPSYDSNGMVELNEPVPFRLTRNMQAFLSHFGVEGPLMSNMCSASQAVFSSKQNEHLRYQLAMFFRDELLSWFGRRPLGVPIPPVTGIATLSSAELKHKVNLNVDDVIGRIRGIAPQYFCEEDENSVEPPQSVQRGVNELVEAALSPRNLCMMDPTWHPWF
ncbi:PREDICTED: transformation/transcription domain-associated protein-like [Camelina sativa]|uniref:Transformation/transcription domain-associated protein-like n=1 Tax=Camelina sativa TaxID=90675 RepID=A0ABM0URD3_CAMSA|nr:PREDICTED: transformation/transcription domain-associated protein-like [Camelina sativa]